MNASMNQERKSKMKIENDTCKIFDQDEPSIYGDTPGLYTIDEFITLLQKAKEIWGNKEIVVYDSFSETSCGFRDIAFVPSIDDKIEDAIAIVI